ncbi:hypothetical protein BDV06DRAFT_183617 [Aspergillus oleicola]
MLFQLFYYNARRHSVCLPKKNIIYIIHVPIREEKNVVQNFIVVVVCDLNRSEQGFCTVRAIRRRGRSFVLSRRHEELREAAVEDGDTKAEDDDAADNGGVLGGGDLLVGDAEEALLGVLGGHNDDMRWDSIERLIQSVDGGL